MLEGIWNKQNTTPLLVGVQTFIAYLEINIVASHKIGNSSYSRPSYAIPGHIFKGYLNLTQEHLINSVYCSFILKTT